MELMQGGVRTPWLLQQLRRMLGFEDPDNEGEPDSEGEPDIEGEPDSVDDSEEEDPDIGGEPDDEDDSDAEAEAGRGGTTDTE